MGGCVPSQHQQQPGCRSPKPPASEGGRYKVENQVPAVARSIGELVGRLKLFRLFGAGVEDGEGAVGIGGEF